MRAVFWSTVAPTSPTPGGSTASSSLGSRKGRLRTRRAPLPPAPRCVVTPGFFGPPRRTFYNIDRVVKVPGIRKGYNVSAGFGVTYERSGLQPCAFDVATNQILFGMTH